MAKCSFDEKRKINNTSKPLSEWTRDEVQQWFQFNYSDHSLKFVGLTGKDLSRFTEGNFRSIIQDTAQGIALYNAVKEVKEIGMRIDLLDSVLKICS